MKTRGEVAAARGYVALRLTLVVAIAVAALSAVPGAQAAKRGQMDAGEYKVLNAINAARARHGLPSLRPSRALARSADYHSWEMLQANFFAHSSRNGGSFHARIRRFARASRVGETIAWVTPGSGGARRIVGMWMNSPPHRAVLLSRQFSRIGIGARAGRLGSRRASVWTANVASRR